VATYNSSNVGFFLWGGYSLLGTTTEFTENASVLLENTTVLGDTWHEHTSTGLKRAELTQSGFYDDASDGINAALAGSLGTTNPVCYTVEGNTVGKHFVGLTGAYNGKYQRLASLGAIHRANAIYTVTGQVDEGIILHALGAETIDGDTTGASSVDNGASSAGGGVAYLHVVAYSGFSSVVFKVQHDTDDSGYSDLITFTTVTGITSERATTAVTVNRHLAAHWNVTGTGSVTFMIGFKRNA
jgi:hypothetical protein